MKNIIVLCVALAGGVTSGAGELDNAFLVGRTDRQPFAYEVGEEAVFSIRLEQAQPFPDGEYFLRWRTQADGGETFRGREPLSYGKPVTVKARIVTNGFVRVLSYVCDREGKRCQRKVRADGLTPEGKKAMNAGETKSKDIIFNGAAAAHPERMRSVPEPADFDAFWAKRKAALAAVPMKVDLKEHPSSSPEAKCYTFSITCAGPRPVTGSLTVPSKPGKYPAEITFHGYAKAFVQKPPRSGPADRLHMFINAHGYELEREPAYYTAFYESVKSNGHTFGIDPEQNSDPDRAYFGGMTYRIMRALEYLKSRPEWDGRNLTAAGGSMGGLQAIWAGALDHDVTKVSALVPWCCDMGGRVTLRRFYPGRPKETVVLRYFDPVNLAKRIPKTTWVDIPRAGLGDESSPPNGVSVLWNNLGCRKSIRWVQGSTHGEEPPKEFREEYFLSGSAETLQVESPDGRIVLGFTSDAKGMSWTLSRKGRTLIEPSPLGLVCAGFKSPGGKRAAPLGEMRVVDRKTRSSDTAWTTTLYRRGVVRDRFNELEIELEEIAEPHRRLGYVFRVYDEGAAFRYVIPRQDGVPGLEVLSERTEWRFPGKVGGWFTSYKSDFNSNEAYFTPRPIADIRADEFIGMPATVEVAGQKVALCEAALRNWAGLYYRTPKDGQPADASVLTAYLTPLPESNASTDGAAVICTTPAASPWRVAICGDDDLDLLRKNDIIVNLNPPPEEGLDFSWVKPGASSWDWWVESNNSLSTELTLKLVDFAAEMGWPYHTVDGGWYGFARRPNHGPNVALEPRPGFDLERIVRHAASKGVGIWVWIHWMEIEDTGVEETFARLEKWGVKGVKTDFIDRQDQWIVCWYEKVCRAAAKHHVMVNFHGAHKPTGTERTWPNNLTREGILGNEMLKFAPRITPAHCATLPFTRFLLGPGDFTPGGFGNVYAKDFVPQSKRGHRYGDETDRRPIWAEEIGTRAHAIAQCIAFDGWLTTLCDWPERYRGADGVEALRKLPTTWKSTTPVSGRCGEHYAVLRESHDGRFYFAAITVKRRPVNLALDFLGDGEWTMKVFADDPERTPGDAKALALASRRVKKGQTVSFELLDEGGAVAIFEKTRQFYTNFVERAGLEEDRRGEIRAAISR